MDDYPDIDFDDIADSFTAVTSKKSKQKTKSVYSIKKELMNKYKTDGTPTHTFIDGGKLNIPLDKLPEVYDELSKNKENPPLTERFSAYGNECKFYVDIDDENIDLNNLKETIDNTIDKLFILNNEQKKYTIWKNKYKNKYHIIYHFKCNKVDALNIMNLVCRDYPDFKEDTSVYNAGLRLPLCNKDSYNKEAKKRIKNDSIYEYHSGHKGSYLETGSILYLENLPETKVTDEYSEFLRLNAEEKMKKTEYKNKVVNDQEIMDLLDLLNQSRYDTYNYWVQVGQALYNTNNDYLCIWDKWSSKSSKYKIGECEEKWLTFSTGENKVTIGTIKYYAKQDNPEAYEKLNNKIYITDPIALKLIELYNNDKFDDYHLSKHIFGVGLKNKIMCGTEKGDIFYILNQDTNIWGEVLGRSTLYNYITELMEEKCNIIIDYLIKKISENIEIEYKKYKKLFEHYMIITDSKYNPSDEEKEFIKEYKYTYSHVHEFQIDIKKWEKVYSSHCVAEILTKKYKVFLMKYLKHDNICDLLDSKRHLLSVKNGVVNLKTGEMRERRPDDYFTYFIPYNYNPTADDTIWDNLVTEIIHNDEISIFLKEYLGYSCTGEVNQQKVLIMYGDGSNGKSILTNTIQRLFEPIYSNFSHKSLKEESGGNNDELYNARNTRMAFLCETKENTKVDPGLFKTISGEDPISTSAKYKGCIKYYPQFKLAMVTNEIPRLPVADPALMRRMLMVHFKMSYIDPDNKLDMSLYWSKAKEDAGLIGRKDKKLGAKLMEESTMEGVLKWFVDGAMKYYENEDIKIPECMLEHILEFREEHDFVKQWIEDNYVFTGDVNDYVITQDLFNRFKEDNSYNISKTKMTKKLMALGCPNPKVKRLEEYDNKTKRCYLGIKEI